MSIKSSARKKKEWRYPALCRFLRSESSVSHRPLPFAINGEITEHSSGVGNVLDARRFLKGNGLVESTNKNLIRLIKRIGSEYKREWHHHLRSALWADRITPKQIFKKSPYKLVYGKDALFPTSLEISALQLLKSMEVAENNPMTIRLAKVMELEEARETIFAALQDRQETIKRWFDSKKSSNLIFRLGNLVLKYNERAAKPSQHAKFDCLWEGPFRILNCKGFNAFKLEDIDGDPL
ncbi:uncharacterized protein LOC131874267 [Cryptomeria japonica]|uniref:uncharacterized protein LOC131874267 n=1 Tax=Cryptomeria japonica TaxID=3369 RepID=UPI0027D9F778|nr:uncharacterized protein LOC131874267 [Cryptomeria japonica]